MRRESPNDPMDVRSGAPPGSDPEAPRKAYRAPSLVRHGNLAELTAQADVSPPGVVAVSVTVDI
jgi:hypothetical protein